ncbi:GumC family protein [Erythrobacter sp. R86502]|uniref:GumC family protein n=1 Tax=Erythrobacter sp. R86502 TaxID=3093846 RepID=UPI0036D39A08
MKSFVADFDQLQPPRRLLRVWMLVRDGLPSVGRYRRYLMALAGPLALVWLLALIYIAFAPDRFDSRMTLILPGTGVGASMNLELIGQATTNTSSAFSSTSLSPTENYKRLLMSDIVLRDAAGLAGEDEGAFPAPDIKLIDQTNVIELRMSARSPEQAQARMQALQQAFNTALEKLRDDEARTREEADVARITELERKVDEAQQALLDFQGKTGLVSLDQFAGRITALDELKANERDRRVRVAETGAAAARLSSTLDITLPQARRAMQLKADPEFQDLLSRYAKASGERARRSGTLGDAHATMEELAAEKNSLKAELARRGAAVTGLGGAKVIALADLSVSNARENLFASLSERDSDRSGHGAALNELRRQISEQSADTKDQVAQAAELAELLRDLRVAEAVFSSALARLDTNKSDPFASYPLVQTLEAPSLPRAKAAPSALLIIAGAIGATFFILIGSLLLWLRQPIIRKLLPNG